MSSIFKRFFVAVIVISFGFFFEACNIIPLDKYVLKYNAARIQGSTTLYDSISVKGKRISFFADTMTLNDRDSLFNLTFTTGEDIQTIEFSQVWARLTTPNDCTLYIFDTLDLFVSNGSGSALASQLIITEGTLFDFQIESDMLMNIKNEDGIKEIMLSDTVFFVCEAFMKDSLEVEKYEITFEGEYNMRGEE